MGAETSIEWVRGADGTPGASWNPVTGCSKVSEGCLNCYAESLAHRFGPPAFPNGFEVTLLPDKLLAPLRWRKPRRIFVNSTSDLFHAEVPTDYIAKVFAVMAFMESHTFMVLTKRPGRMRSLLGSPAFVELVEELFDQVVMEGRDAGIIPKYRVDQISRAWWRQARWPLANVWLGVTVESQKWAGVRIPLLQATPAAYRFLSMEPLLQPVDARSHLQKSQAEAGIDWVIVGGESGPHARRMDPDWARSLRDQCATAGVPFMFKQAGAVLAKQWETRGAGTDPTGWPEDLRVREVPEAAR